MSNRLSLVTKMYILIGSLTCLTLADFLLTKNFLAVAGLAGEWNPLMRSVAEHLGVNGILAAKLAGNALFALCIPIVRPAAHRWIFVALVLLNIAILIPVCMGFYAVSLTF